MGAHSPRARATHNIPKPYVPSNDSTRDPNAAQLALFQDKLRDFKAENTLLGKLLREVQAERQSQERRLESSQSQIEELRTELLSSRAQTAALQQEVEILSTHAAKKDKHLQQSLATRRELEALVLDLSEQLAQPNQGVGSSQHQEPAAVHHTAVDSTPLNAPNSPPASPTAQQQRPPAASRGGQVFHNEAWCPAVKACRRPVGSPVRSPGRTHPDLRFEVARLEELYQSKLRLVHQEAGQKLEALQRESRQARATAQAEAQAAVQALRDEVVQQVAEAEASLERQVQQQVRVLDQLHKRCAALESQLVAYQSGRISVSTTQPLVGTAATAPEVREGSRAELVNLKQQLARLRQQLVECQACKAQAVASAGAAAAALESQTQVLNENSSRLAKLRQDVCQSVEQQHELMVANTQLQQQVTSLTTQVADAEAAIQDLRNTVCDLRLKVLATQAMSLAEVLQLADEAAKQSDQPQEVSLLSREGPVSMYIRVLQHAVKESDAREAALRRAVTEAQYLEDQSRRMLAAARQDALAMQRTLLKKCTQVQVLGAVRLKDTHELAALHA